MSCASPILHEQLVEYWTSDLPAGETERIEAHLFGCEWCTHAAERVSQIVQAFRGALPPVIGREHLAALRAAGLTVVENDFAPGVRTPVTFERHVDLLIHRLGGLALAQAERVDVIVRSETGGPIFEEPDAVCDRDRGEVLIACQRHFAAFPRDIAVDVRVHRGGAPPTVTSYLIPHVFG